ncbi:MAG: 30S ribosomal protein S12 methylthiotransferase RimO [Clostridiales bacterium]|nr:30S ribosomal protein S12 methylthiotransferase RimO [Clostridiales bacterium]
MTKSVGVITLGCDKNRVDTENMLYYLARGGYDLTNDYESAQILIVNTCAFIESARKEGIETILSAARYKDGKCEKLIVTGCLPQKHRAELIFGLPEVDAFLGTDEYASICSVIRSLYGENEEEEREQSAELPRLVTTPQHYAYLKIAEGCDNFCTFCTIPSIRGKYRSRSEEALLREAAALAEQGVKELILVAQDVTRYGTDTNETNLVSLLKKLSAFPFASLRLMYCYPELVSDELIAEIVSNPKIAKYIDVPIQHIDDTLLKRMNRRSTGEQIKTLFRKLKENGIAVRTTVMVGFPQETEEAFENLCAFIRTYKPYHVGVFAYSREEGTPAYKLKGQIPLKVKRQRVNTVGALHLKNREETCKALIGKTLTVLYEDVDYKRKMFVGRTQYDAPEIDTKVFFTADFVDVGEYYPVRITGFDGYDLIGVKAE